MDSDNDSDRFDDDSGSEESSIDEDEDEWFLDLQRIREDDPLKTELYWGGNFLRSGYMML
ncbi:hypothetical protein QTG54_002697 [Skeletonema marinoi]|uniref:Uncharacterized protein n=1 Tax=Skeletonema marinoi TaxID=267567 RepID=A0AAD8YJA9_9STRA|nr:hypothetical protein QTG54_002697 [Skeletonema marinoi]